MRGVLAGLVVIRISDEENCIYIPTKAKLAELGFNTDLLVPWSLIDLGAWPHRAAAASCQRASCPTVSDGNGRARASFRPGCGDRMPRAVC